MRRAVDRGNESEPGRQHRETGRRDRKITNHDRDRPARLRDADLAESQDRVWSLTEPPALKETPRWTGPVSAQRRRVEAEEREDA